MAYRLIAIDIDGTLLNEAEQIPPRVLDAIQQAKKKGAYVVLSTGRTRKGALRFYEALALNTPFITAGGAEVHDASGRLMFSQNVDPALVRKVLEFAYKRGLHPQVYIDGELVFREHNEYAAAYERPYGFPGVVVPELMEMGDIATPKVLYVMEADQVADVRNETKALFPTLTIKQSRPTYLEFMDPAVSKGKALEFVAAHYGLNMSEVIAIGDTEIDAPMIEAAGLGVAVDNAYEHVKQTADIVCPSNDDGGVADVIHQYILEAGK